MEREGEEAMGGKWGKQLSWSRLWVRQGGSFGMERCSSNLDNCKDHPGESQGAPVRVWGYYGNSRGFVQCLAGKEIDRWAQVGSKERQQMMTCLLEAFRVASGLQP